MLRRMKLVVIPPPLCVRMEVAASFVGFKRGARVACVPGPCARCTCSLALHAGVDRSATYARGLLVTLRVSWISALMEDNKND